MSASDEKLEALLRELRELTVYMRGRGEKTRSLSVQFAENAKKDSSSREFDLNQARMLDYQHHLWHEISNMLDKLLKKYE